MRHTQSAGYGNSSSIPATVIQKREGGGGRSGFLVNAAAAFGTCSSATCWVSLTTHSSKRLQPSRSFTKDYCQLTLTGSHHSLDIRDGGAAAHLDGVRPVCTAET